MSFKAHKEDDSRACGATTIVQNQSTVYVNNKLWAVKGSINSHGAGGLLNSTGSTVLIENIEVIVHGPDLAEIDGLGHEAAEDETATGSDDVEAY